MKANDELERTLETQGMITVARAAELLRGVRRQAIYGWVASKAVKARWVGRRLFVNRSDVERQLGIDGGRK